MRSVAQQDARVDVLRRALAGVDGWLGLDEAWALHEAARRCQADEPQIAEIGAFEGRSTIALALGLRARGRGRLLSIDPHGVHPRQYERFLVNIEAAGVRDLVQPIVATSHDARPQVADRSLDLLFVDGSHHYEDVCQDITDWEGALANDAVVAFNDPYDGGVQRALLDLVARVGSPYRNPRWSQNTMFFDYAPSRAWTTTDAQRLRRLRMFLRAGYRLHRLHWRVVTNKHLPLWLKRFQMHVRRKVLGTILPRTRAL